MKKFAKVSLITVGILLAAGIVFCLISLAVGGKRLVHIASDDEFLRNKFEGLENIVETIDDKLGTRDWHGFRGNWTWGNTTVLTVNGDLVPEKEGDYQISADKIKQLDLKQGVGSLELEEKAEADGMIDIYVQGVGDFNYYVSEHTLYVSGLIQGVNIGETDNRVTIRIPAGMDFEEVSTEVGAGRMNIYSLRTKKFSTEIGAGEAYLEDVKTDSFSAEIGAGTMTSQNIQSTKAEIDVAVGSCSYFGTIQGEADVECGLGDIIFSLDGKEEDYNYNIECAAGSIQVGDMHMTALAGERYVDNGAASTFEIACSMGNVTLYFEE